MHPFHHAATTPDKPAVIVAETGAIMTYAELNDASNRVAQLFRARGLQPEARVAFFLTNTPYYYALVWGAQRAGLRFVAVSSKLTAPEVDYILTDSGAALLVAGADLANVAVALDSPCARFSFGGAIAGFDPWEDAVVAMPVTPIPDETAGASMLYSSGTTGRPKGIRSPMPLDPAIDAVNPLTMLAHGFFGLGPDSVYLSTAPLYHAAPLAWTMVLQKLGGTVVLMSKFDAEAALGFIEQYRCNAGQFVPTHFVRMLKLPEATRAKYDV